MKAAIIAGIVALLVSASAATATFVVTSKNIKNGTIQTIDISARAKKALRGQRGPQGTVGDITMVATPTTVPPGQPGGAEATCPAGQQPISGGFSSSGAMAITINAADADRRMWLVTAWNSSPSPQGLTAVAYCAKVTVLHP